MQTCGSLEPKIKRTNKRTKQKQTKSHSHGPKTGSWQKASLCSQVTRYKVPVLHLKFSSLPFAWVPPSNHPPIPPLALSTPHTPRPSSFKQLLVPVDLKSKLRTLSHPHVGLQRQASCLVLSLLSLPSSFFSASVHAPRPITLSRKCPHPHHPPRPVP